MCPRAWKLVRGSESISSVEGTLSKGERDRDLERAQTLSERRTLHVYIEQKAELAVQRECAAQKRLSEAESEMDRRNWERRNADIALYETNQELESLILELHQAKRKVNLCGELEMRNRLFQKSRARDCQEIEELWRICCEETDRARQWKIEEFSTQQERNPSSVSQLLTQIQDLQNKVNSSTDTRDLYDPETASSSGASHVSSQPLNIPSPRAMLSRDSGLPLDTRNSMGISGNVFERHLLEKDHPQLSSRYQRMLHLLTDQDQEIQWHMEDLWDEIRRVLQYQPHVSIKVLKPWTVYHTGGTYILRLVRWITRDIRYRNCIVEKFPDNEISKNGKSTSRLKYVQILVPSCHNAMDQRSRDAKIACRVQGGEISPTAKSALHWKRLSWVVTSDGE